MRYSTKKHIAFDLDDTLTESYPFNQRMFLETFDPFVDIKEPNIAKYLKTLHLGKRGLSMLDQFREAIQHFDIDASAEDLVIRNEQMHIDNIHRIKVVDYAAELLMSIKASGKFASICTNRQTESLDKILKTNKLEQYFTHIISCTDAGHEKPDPFCLNLIVNTSGMSPEDFVYIGDSQTDLKFAANAGVDFLKVNHYHEKVQAECKSLIDVLASH